MRQLTSAFSLIFLIFIISSCGCNTECGDCEILDEENCECIVDLECQCSDGIQNGNETSTDCGGECNACFECTTNNCIILSGGSSSDEVTSKTWVYVNEGFEPYKDMEWIDRYYSNGFLSGTTNGTSASGTWKFDNPSSPTAIIQTYNENAPASWSPGEPLTYPLEKLSSDTLRMKHSKSNISMLFIPEQ